MSSDQREITLMIFFYFQNRNLADISNDNLLDVSEFIVAVHLINGILRGRKVPAVLPENLTVTDQEEVSVELPSVSEREAYVKVFKKHDKSGKGFINGKIKTKIVDF